MFAVYSVLIVKHSVENRFNVNDLSKSVTWMFAFITIVFTIGFVFYINGQIYSQKEPDVLENFIRRLGLAETLFGIYLSIILKELFKEKRPGA